MKKFILLILTFSLFQACEVDDTGETCSDKCTSVIGKIIRADNTGIPNVKVTFSFVQFAPYSYTRDIAETYTDDNGNYEIIGFIKDRELGELNKFLVSVEIDPIENALSDIFLKPSELLPQTVPSVNEIIIPGVDNREQIQIVDFTVPFKSDLTVRLNNFQPIESVDNFRFRCDVQYGFENQKFSVNFDETEQVNQEFNFVTGIGANSVRIFKIKNGSSMNGETQEVVVTDNPSNITLDFEY